MKTKNTHTVQDIENWMHDLTNQIENAETKTEKHALIKKLKSLESHYNSCQDKNINGKAYPTKKEAKDIPKRELLALIDSVETVEDKGNDTRWFNFDVTGVSVGSNRFTYVD